MVIIPPTLFLARGGATPCPPSVPVRLAFMVLACITAVTAFDMGREAYRYKCDDGTLYDWCLVAAMALLSAICLCVVFGAPC